ncbi:DUF3293 domain-containing protein [Shewanella algae]|uniref:DUF3293 domain-containing protein n=1 Tax=Shewanella algae TaxID=38313 RepID=UPI0011838D44|nr:DUF3293 domain-containing protein [Shewanella algae]TVO87484.1 hypothetical protein AYI78_06360 [Shewanella algae]TVO95412.1 hypothetical protein AYI79_10850 [Shewanella algae]
MDAAFEGLWQYYQSACFLLTQSFSSAVPFAIVTAHNPLGQKLTSCQNRLLDRQLQHDIDKLGIPYRAIIGAADDLSHMEKSWALFLDKAAAIELASKYRQNALYYVDSGLLTLVPCLKGEREVALGQFAARARLVSELPELSDG